MKKKNNIKAQQANYLNKQHKQHSSASIKSIEDSISKVLSTLDASAALNYLDTLDPNTHFVQCFKSQIYFKLGKFKEAKHSCQKAFQIESTCKKCIQLYLQIGQNTSDNQNVINFLAKKFKNTKFSDSFISNNINKNNDQVHNQNNFQNFFEDLKNNGAEFSKIQLIENATDNRSVVAKWDMKKDETILFIPKKKLILLQNTKKSEIVKKIQNEKLYLRSPKHCQLSIFLLQQEQLQRKSEFYYYISHLPKTFFSFPVNFTQEQLNQLKGSPFLQQVQQKKLDMHKDYQAICNLDSTFSRFSFEDFKRFRLIVSSRIFGISIGKHKTDTLVPLADMLNHHLPKQTSWYYSDSRQGFLIKSLQDIIMGQQIYDSYGQKCNSRFLLNYGFTLKNNQANQVAIRISIQFEDPDKQEFVKQIILKISKNLDSKQFQEMISVLRYSINEELSSDSQEINLQNIKKTPFQDINIELKIWQKLEKIVQGQINAYPTSLKQDAKILEQKDLPLNVYNCVILRKGQKQILMFYLKMCKSLIKYFKKGCVVKGNQLKNYESYLTKIKFS